MNNIRDKFEAWFTGEVDSKTRRAMMEKDDAGYYKFQSAYNAWNVWQAATQASESEINSLKQRVDELQADNLRLRDALEESKNVLEIAMTDRDGNKFVYLNTRSGSMLSVLDTLDKCNKALSATAKQSLIEHDNEVLAPHKKAIEFAEYMAKCIEQFMVTVNELDIADEQEDETLVDILQERRGEYWRAVNTSVYEFRKRSDVALKA